MHSDNQSRLLKSLQRKNIELAKANAALSVKLATANDTLLQCMHDKIHEQEQRLEMERKLMEAMSALDVLKVEVGKRVPVMEAVAGHLMDTASLFKHLLQLDYGEILMERIVSACVVKDVKDKRDHALSPIPEEE